MEIKIYIANLGKYNEGELVGDWFTLPVDMSDVAEKIGLNEQYEECAIHDYEAPFEISEYTNIDRLNEWAEIINNLSEEDEVIEAIINNYSNVEEGLEILQNSSYRVWNDCSDMSDVAYSLYDESGQLSELEKHINPSYINWDAIGRDIKTEGIFLQVNYDTYVEITN